MLLFSHWVMSDSSQSHELQHAKLPCPSPSPGACSNSCLSSWWCHPPILPSIFPIMFSSESVLHIRWPKYCSFSFSINFPMNIQGWFLLGKDSKSLLQNHSSKASILWCSACFLVQSSYPYMTTGKTIALTIQIFVGKVTSLLFNMLSRFVWN